MHFKMRTYGRFPGRPVGFPTPPTFLLQPISHTTLPWELLLFLQEASNAFKPYCRGIRKTRLDLPVEMGPLHKHIYDGEKRSCSARCQS